MFKKMVPMLIIIFIAITLIAIGAFVLWNYIMKDSASQDPSAQAKEIANSVEIKTLTALERTELTYSINEVTTNLSDINYVVRISFAFVVDNKLTREEIELVRPLILDIIGNTLSDTEPEEIRGSVGRDELKSKLMNRINPQLKEGNLREINISDFIITQR